MKSLVFTLVLLFAANASAQDAAAVLKNAAAAMGADKVTAIRVTGTGWNSPVGQGYTPAEDWPRVDVTAYTRVFHYDGRWASEEWTRVQGNNPPRGGGGLPIQEWGAAVNGEWKQRFYVNGEFAWNVDGGSTNAAPGPRLSSSAAGLRPEVRQLDIWLSPHGVLKAAMAAKDASAMALTLEGQPKTVVTFTAMGKYRVNATITADNLVERVQTWIANPVFGDMVYEHRYTEYRDYGGVKFPGLVHTHQGDPRLNPGHNSQEIRVSAVEVNPAGLSLPVPENIRKAGTQPTAPRAMSEPLAPGIWRIAGESHHSILVEFRDFLTVVEAPQDELRSLAVIGEVRRLVPNKPIRYVVNTHYHFDHSGGLRTYVAMGATVVTHARNREFYEDVFFYPAPRTLEPDLLSTRYPWFRGNRANAFETVTDKYVISDGVRTLDVLALQGIIHDGNMLVAYLPTERILINADMFGPPAPNAPLPTRPNTNVRELAANIRRLNLAVDRHVGIHGGVSANDVFMKIAAQQGSN
ncbi:MAG: MBL fold metallo-hydrolase [Acidimicrobiia bacterium]|nr:MBL fold metallo-hydrolase [Acidimicrobiia bacterium]